MDNSNDRSNPVEHGTDNLQPVDNLPVTQSHQINALRERLIQALLTSPDNVQAAGLAAGYKESYVKSGAFYRTVNTLLASEEFRKAADNFIQGSDLTKKILRVCKIDDKILTMIEKEPEKYVKLQSVPKQLKQQYGLLAPDQAPQEMARVTINQLNMFIQSDFDVAKALHYRDKITGNQEVIDITTDKKSGNVA